MADSLDALADFACNTQISDIEPKALAHLRAILADTLAVCAIGNQEQPMRQLLALQREQVAGGQACVLGTDHTLNALDAAALNAAAGCWLELDEGNLTSNGHPGIQVIPSALAVAQQLGRSGADFLLASAIGYEVVARIGSACDMRMSIHPHGTYGVVGAAVATARLLGLGRQAMREVISLAGSSPIAGNRQGMKEGATLRNWYAAHSAQMGQMAVRLVEAGFTAPIDGIAPTCNDILYDNLRPEDVVRDLGRDWLLGEGYIKLYPCGRPVHAAIDALRAALASAPQAVRAADIARIEVRGFRFVVYLDRTDIRNAFATRFSTPFALASVAWHGSHGLECFEERAAANPQILELARRVEMTEVPAYTSAFPARQLCDVIVVLADGSRLEGHCEVMRGEPGNPADPAEYRDKFFAIGNPIWGETLCARIHEAAMQVDALADMRAFAGGQGI